MIIVKKSGYLKYKNFKFRCALGKGGIKQKEREGMVQQIDSSLLKSNIKDV